LSAEGRSVTRLGLLGGSFNPIHNGHLSLAHGFIKLLGLDRLLLIPVWSPPHKSARDMLPADERLTFCRLACKGDPVIEASDIELLRGGTSYTVDTLRALEERYPRAQLFLITGADMFLTLEGWREFAEIARRAELCVCARHTGELAALRDYAKKLERNFGARCHVGDFPVVEVSSTQLRGLIKSGGDVGALLPQDVYAHIRAHHFYTENQGEQTMDEKADYNLPHFRELLKGRLSEKRFYHSLMVSEAAVALARQYGGDIKKAEFAGLVHDIEKDTPRDAQLQTVAKYSIILDNVEAAAPKLLHAICGAAVLKNEYHIEDTEVLDAIRYHTTARAGMSLLEKIIYLADYISADRDFDGVQDLRRTVHASLEAGMDAALEFSIRELLQKRAPIHIDTLKARNALIIGE
jgi:nicotinate-nucleotide adenylyltransferase